MRYCGWPNLFDTHFFVPRTHCTRTHKKVLIQKAVRTPVRGLLYKKGKKLYVRTYTLPHGGEGILLSLTNVRWFAAGIKAITY